MAAATGDKPSRDYLRVPDEWAEEINRLAARYDVPARSITRLLIGLGLECVRLDESRAAFCLEQLASPMTTAAPVV